MKKYLDCHYNTHPGNKKIAKKQAIFSLNIYIFLFYFTDVIQAKCAFRPFFAILQPIPI